MAEGIRDIGSNGNELENFKKKLPENNITAESPTEDSDVLDYIQEIDKAYCLKYENGEAELAEMAGEVDDLLAEAEKTGKKLTDKEMMVLTLEVYNKNSKIKEIMDEMSQNTLEPKEDKETEQIANPAQVAEVESVPDTNPEKIDPEMIQKVSEQDDEFREILISKNGFRENGRFILEPIPSDKKKYKIYEIKEDGAKIFAGTIILNKEKLKSKKNKSEKKEKNNKPEKENFSEKEMRFIQEVYVELVGDYETDLKEYFSTKNGYEKTDIKNMIRIEMKRFWKKILPDEIRNDGDIPSEKIGAAIEKIEEIIKSKK